MTTAWSLSTVQDVIAEVVPDRDMLVSPDQRRTYRQVAERTRALAGFLVSRGISLSHERDQLERWSCGQSRVGVVMRNRLEYLETMQACFRARAVPFNVNQQYAAGEIGELLDQVGTAAVVYQRALGPHLADALAGRPSAHGPPPLLVDVDDRSGIPPLEGSTEFETAIAAGAGTELPTPSGDDLYVVCTGGTTGRPKTVLWRQADIFVAGMGGVADATAESLVAALTPEPQVWFPAPPLMHAAAQWTAFAGLHAGGTIVLVDDEGRGFDAATTLALCEREGVSMMSIVGDAYARPLIEELRRRTYRLDGLQRVGTGGAMTSVDNKEALVELVPGLTVVDGYGASETGGMAFGVTSRALRIDGHAPASGGAVLSADRSRFVEPGEEEIGWIARRGLVPLGYLDDRAATEVTFPIVDGERLAVPGDRGRLLADGAIELLGRDSMVVNTGGEKVFVEEVEQALLRHPAVEDALVVGRPSERFGQEVVAVVQLRPGNQVDGNELREFCAASLARFKAPRAVAFTDRIQRHPSGKADYRWARAVADDAPALATTGG
jgi:3-oxocholest-4-en-26-oate---CoA ligase